MSYNDNYKIEVKEKYEGTKEYSEYEKKQKTILLVNGMQ